MTDNNISGFAYPSATQIIVACKVRSTGNLLNIAEYTLGSEGRVTKLVSKSRPAQLFLLQIIPAAHRGILFVTKH